MNNTRFSVAVHVLSVLCVSDGEPVTSSVLAASVGTNPVVIRKLLVMLSKASLVSVDRGKAGGARLARPAREISLADVLDAVVTSNEMTKMHSNPNPACPVGKSIASVLDAIFSDGFEAYRSVMKQHSIASLAVSISKQGG